MFFSTGAAFSPFFVINLFVMSFYCHEKKQKENDLLTIISRFLKPIFLKTEGECTVSLHICITIPPTPVFPIKLSLFCRHLPV